MRIGFDFDNTIVSYDQLFHQVALEKGLLPPPTHPVWVPGEQFLNKLAIRDYLRETDQEALWTLMQGEVYGARMNEAQAYPGVVEAIQRLQHEGHQVMIVSHRTRHPYVGEPYDLHAAALQWVATHLCLATEPLLSKESIFFEVTKEKKLQRIGALACDVFIDDLPEILSAPHFPLKTKRILFDPDRRHAEHTFDGVIHAWSQLVV